MTSRLFTQSIKDVLSSGIAPPVFVYDENTTETLPCVLVGVESETAHETLSGNFELKAYIAILTNGHDDAGNEDSETIVESVFETLTGAEVDCLDGLFFDGAERQDGEASTQIFLNFTAVTHI